MTISVEFEGLGGAGDYFRRMPDQSAKAASMAINQVATRGGMKLAQDAIIDQIAFPKDYLRTGDRLMVTRFSTPESLEAVISGRKRATSLARFAQGQALNKVGLSVRVKNGSSSPLRSAWLVRLKKGASLDEDNYNVGLAVRVRSGDITNKNATHQSWLVTPNEKGAGVALLYGPSVDQVFRQVAGQIGEPIGELLAAEFFRQFDRITS